MQKLTLLSAVLVAAALAATGCVVHEREVVRPAEPCPGAVWVERGDHSHWECPERREKVEVQIRP
jgi:hypothetical protein